MTYNTIEVSTEDGQPIELYEFKQGSQSWYFTSSADVYTYMGVDYTPETITRDTITQNNDISKSKLVLSFPRINEFANQFLGKAPDLVTTLTLKRGHTTNSVVEFVAYWKGRVIVGTGNASEIKLECESIFSSMKRTGLRVRYQLACRHALYGQGCNKNMDSYAVQGIVQSSSGNQAIVSQAGSHPDGYFSGGIIKTSDGAMRFIVNQVGAVLTVSRPFVSPIGGQNVNIYPGCDHSKQTCINKFDNLLNFGGFPYIPYINPFSGLSII